MNINKSLFRTTLLFSLACGICFVPVTVLFACLVPLSAAFCLTMWLCLVLYGAFLAGWAGVDFTSIIFPLLIPLPFIWRLDLEMPFIVLLLFVLLVMIFFSGCFNLVIQQDVDYPEERIRQTLKKIDRIHARHPGRKGKVTNMNFLVYNGDERLLVSFSVPIEY